MLASRAAAPARASASRAGLVRNAPHRDSRNDQRVSGPQGGRQGRGVKLGKPALGRLKLPDQEQAADLQIARMRGIDAVAMRFERRPRGIERLRRPGEVARGERNFGLGDQATRAGHGLLRTEGARRAAQQRLRPNQVAELRHRDAAQRERGGVVAERDPVQRTERITRRECTRRRRDQRIHSNPDTLVTPTRR